MTPPCSVMHELNKKPVTALCGCIQYSAFIAFQEVSVIIVADFSVVNK